MLENILGNIQQSQADMQKKLDEHIVEQSIQDGAIKIKMTASRKILDLVIDKEKVDLTDVEMLQDLLLEAFNQSIAQATAKEQEVSKGLIQNMLPGDMGNLFG